MCLGVPGRIVERSAVWPDLAKVEVEGVLRDINVSLLEDNPQPGEWVLIHLGFALERMTEAEARETVATMALLTQDEPGDPFAALDAAAPPVPADPPLPSGSPAPDGARS